MPGTILSMGSCSPIRPVEHTKRRSAEMPSASAVFSAVVCVFWKPCGPVHALAPPELRITASTRPSETTCRDQWTGRRGNPVGGEDGGRRLRRSVVDHEGQIRIS